MTKETLSIPRFIWSVIKPYRWWYVLMMQAPIVNSFYKVSSMFSLKLLVDAFVINEKPEYSELMLPIAIFIGAIFVMELGWRLSHFAWMKTQPKVRAEIIARTYNYVQHHSFEFFQNNFSGSLVSKIKGVLDGYNNLWFGIHHRIAVPVLESIVIIISLALINSQLFYFMLIWSLVFFCVMLKMSMHVGKLAKRTADSRHMAIGMVADNLSNISSLFAFASRTRELFRLNFFLKNNTAKKDYAWLRFELIMSFVGIAFYLSMLVSLLFFMIYLKRAGVISTGDLIFVMSLALFFVDNIWLLVAETGSFFGHIGDFKSSFSVLAKPHDNLDKEDVKRIKIKNGNITFKNIGFKYQDEDVFKDLNLAIKSGEKIGLVGHSGAGKSTLISLLLKNFKITKGDILVDDISIYDVASDSLRSQIAVIPQDMMLFHRTISDNIKYANPQATKQQIEEAAKKAHIHDFILSLDKGYNTMVGERGVKLSGGQRQRIAIARAILKDAPILILDEATSSLDSKTEKLIQDSINNLMQDKKRTIIAVAHRLSTLKNMDRIIVIDKGQVIEEGKHDELIKKQNSFYKKLWELQEF